MNAKWMQLAGELLERASDEFSNHGCNAYDWPDDWTEDDKRQLSEAMAVDNIGKPLDKFNANQKEDLEGDIEDCPGDWRLMEFLGKQLNKSGDKA